MEYRRIYAVLLSIILIVSVLVPANNLGVHAAESAAAEESTAAVAEEVEAKETTAEENTVEETEAEEVAAAEPEAEEVVEPAATEAEAEEAEAAAATEAEAEEVVESAAAETEVAEAAETETVEEEAADSTEEADASEEDSEEELILTDEVEAETYVPEDATSSEDLFADYVDSEFGISDSSKPGLLFALRRTAGSRLTSDTLTAYTYISAQLPAIAAGESTSTVFALPSEDMTFTDAAWTAEDLGVDSIVVDGAIGSSAKEAASTRLKEEYFDLSLLIDALLADHPYLLYWYDKTERTLSDGYRYRAYKSNGVWYIGFAGSVVLSFPVAEEFSAGEYTVDSSVGQTVQTAVENAQSIVALYESKSDYEKLVAYRQEICSLTSYNYEAISTETAYGNPWQLIWVFDGDAETDVVCEGYSKAFKYLCDQSVFTNDIDCKSMTGAINGGGHMWNVVTMEDGNNYLVDVTNCDEGTLGADDKLFLVGTSGSPEEGYTFSISNEYGTSFSSVTYTYDEDMLALWSTEELSLYDTIYHAYGEWEVLVEATCTEPGSRRRFCSICGYEDEEVVDALGHDLTAHEAKAPTYDEEGNSAYWYCNRCGLYFADEDGQTQIEENSWVIEKLIRPSIEDARISGIEDKIYTGEEITQEVVIEYSGVTLTEGTDYTVTYENNVNAGTAGMEIAGAGDYQGTVAYTFTIEKAEQPLAINVEKIVYGKTATIEISGAKNSVVCEMADESVAAITSDDQAGTVKVKGIGIGVTTLRAAAGETENYKETEAEWEIRVVPGASSHVELKNVASGIKISWNQVTGAKYYKVYRGTEYLFTTSRLYATDTAVKYKNGTKYTYKVFATTTKDSDSGDSTICRTGTGYRLIPVGIISLKNTPASKMTVTYDENDKSSGYVIRFGLRADMSGAKVITVKGADTLKRVLGGVTKGKTYYVQVRTYKLVNNVRYYSGYCTTKKVKIIQ